VARSGLWLTIAASAVAPMTTGAASAQLGGNSIQIAGRVVSFLQPGPSGTVTAAIIYQPGDAASENEALAIERALGTGLTVGSLTLKPRRVAASALDQLAGAKVAFVTRGTNYREIAAATARRSILTITSDPSCTRAGYCIVTISSTGRVQITVSKSASAAAKLRFTSGFLMLIREI
jgi:hypothetical protein